jgi:predicted aldo/keto reductase-like oxidoreductase
MQYRRFGKLDWKVSALGFGAMRLPTLGKEMSSPVNEPEAIRMIRYAVDHGVNYIDTAYPYHMGNSEKVVGKALQEGYRKKVRLATKLPINMIQKPEEFDRIFSEQLERLQTNKVNYYLLHGLNKNGWRKVRDWGVIPWAESKLAAGKIDYLGFSFHDDFETFKEIIDYYDKWTFCQIQYNYIDVNSQAGRRGVEYAAGKGLAIVVMEPLRGGMITKTPPQEVAKVWETAPQKRSLAERGLLWVWNQPEISLALSGMSTMDQVIENLAIADRSGPGKLTPEDLALYDRVRETYKSLSPIPCTKCRYCAPCPNGVDIPGVFELYNDVSVYDEPRLARIRYQSPHGMKPESRADKCLECGTCVEKCPQQIDIPDWLKKAHEKLSAQK